MVWFVSSAQNGVVQCDDFDIASARIRKDSWKDDLDLKNAFHNCANQGLRHLEILDFARRNYCKYACSLLSLDRDLPEFDISYIDRTATVNEVENAVFYGMEGTGKLLGCRVIHKKLRQVHELLVPRDLVYAVMYNVDPIALDERAPKFNGKKAGNFISLGPKWVHSLDGHHKLMGYQNSTFPTAEKRVHRYLQ